MYKYFEVELIDKTKRVVKNRSSMDILDELIVNEIKGTTVIEEINFSRKEIIENLNVLHIEYPVYKSHKDIKVKDIVVVPVGKENDIKAKVVKFVDKPRFKVREIIGKEK